MSGALTAFHLAQNSIDAEIVLLNERPDFGLGLAYGTPSLRHLLNVPAGKISALPDEPRHFLNWLQAHHDAGATEKTFAPRAVFGQYIQSLLAEVPTVRREVATVLDVVPGQSGAALLLADGRTLHATHVVLATGNFDPAPLRGVSPEAIATGAYHHNAWAAATYSNLPETAPVAIIGTGLTGVDVVLRLRELGHKGTIVALSRHGIFPHRHADYTPARQTAIPLNTPASALAYLRAFRASINTGTEWRAAVDSLRNSTNDLWLRLPLAEQQRFRRHLQRRWDVVRHRMAPSIADHINAELADRTLQVHEGHLQSINSTPSGAQITLQTHNGTESFTVNRVINCTGPSMNYKRVDSPLLQQLFLKQIATAGPLGTGFRCAANGALLNAEGHASSVFFNLGPGRLGTLLESIAVPEIRNQAHALAQTLTALLAGHTATHTQTAAPVAAAQVAA